MRPPSVPVLMLSVQALLFHMDQGVAFTPSLPHTPRVVAPPSSTAILAQTSPDPEANGIPLWKHATNLISGIAIGSFLSASVLFAGPVWAENELSDKYGGAGLDTSLVDQNCLIDKCTLQAKACLADDPSCRKGLTCTAKCLGDNSCITGCMARYGNQHLDNFLKCTIEDNECIKIAILEGGADVYGQEPRAPAPTLANFDPKSLQGQWYKVAGYNPNYDCYACQRNSFAVPTSVGTNNKDVDRLQMEVEFSMPHLLPDGSPPPPTNQREVISFVSNELTSASDFTGAQSIGLNAYHTRETMVFDHAPADATNLVWDKGTKEGMTYARTAHSEGEMFGLKFWENWYILGENDPGTPEFKFIFYNGKTRQNTYEGAFVYSRTKDLNPESMQKVYQIAKDAGMNPDQFCRIRNGCFQDEEPMNPGADTSNPSKIPFRGFLASTKVSEILGVESVAALDMVRSSLPPVVQPEPESTIAAPKRAWWYEVGDYLENPHRHFQTMQDLRAPMEWPKDIVAQKK
eukprot:CAMPEP_0172473082 /NCGR_PEP_ID=MMETSP1065-20121228/68674_1 /TAXON_ID=265537 /ORGANISM="Amphiprora paludosa, Strain CCMP125" /LENGTH=516 /DNA_ID=CAMNT_0013231251 /DNA_START=172 /DNA_END=1722 /DNA_ORIENTATION=+